MIHLRLAEQKTIDCYYRVVFVTQADLYSGSLFIQKAIGDSSDTLMYTSTSLLLVIAITFTIVGGLKAVIWTDLLQSIIMIGGAVVLAVRGGIVNVFLSAKKEVCMTEVKTIIFIHHRSVHKYM